MRNRGSQIVIPAKAGIQSGHQVDPGFRRGDDGMGPGRRRDAIRESFGLVVELGGGTR